MAQPYSHTRSSPNQHLSVIKEGLRLRLATLIAKRPDEVFLRIPFDQVPHLSRVPENYLPIVLKQLDHYSGAALPNGPFAIPWPYTFHVVEASGTIEVLLYTDTKPLRRIADAVASLAAHQARVVDIDVVFKVLVPSLIVEYVGDLSPLQRSNFNKTLARRLKVDGLSIHGGSLSSGLQIRRNR